MLYVQVLINSDYLEWRLYSFFFFNVWQKPLSSNIHSSFIL